jgi:hypothetical protein
MLVAHTSKGRGEAVRWILRLAPFKFKVQQTRSVDNVVPDALSGMFEGQVENVSEMNSATLWESLPLYTRH